MIVFGRRIAIAEWKGTSDRSQINRKRSALGGALALPDHDHSSWTCSSERRSARPSRPSLTDSLTKSKRTTFSTHTGTRRSRPRWPAPLVEPGAGFTHLLALRRRRVALSGRGLVALGRRAPTQLDAVVGVVRISRATARSITSRSVSVHAEPSLRGYENLRVASSDASTRCNSAFTSATLLSLGIA